MKWCCLILYFPRSGEKYESTYHLLHVKAVLPYIQIFIFFRRSGKIFWKLYPAALLLFTLSAFLHQIKLTLPFTYNHIYQIIDCLVHLSSIEYLLSFARWLIGFQSVIYHFFLNCFNSIFVHFLPFTLSQLSVGIMASGWSGFDDVSLNVYLRNLN